MEDYNQTLEIINLKKQIKPVGLKKRMLFFINNIIEPIKIRRLQENRVKQLKINKLNSCLDNEEKEKYIKNKNMTIVQKWKKIFWNSEGSNIMKCPKCNKNSYKEINRTPLGDKYKKSEERIYFECKVCGYENYRIEVIK